MFLFLFVGTELLQRVSLPDRRLIGRVEHPLIFRYPSQISMNFVDNTKESASEGLEGCVDAMRLNGNE